MPLAGEHSQGAFWCKGTKAGTVALVNMVQELLGIPGMNFGLATTRINEALTAIQNENMWSFQMQDGGWLTPGLLGGPNTEFLSPGTITVTPFTTTITGDATASAAWLANIVNPPLLTQQQIRVPYYSLYSIIAADATNTNAVVLTIDRPWMEPAQTLAGYMIYQAYFPAPPGFKRWYNIRDTTNNNQMDWWSKTQIDLANEDAERTDFDEPLYVVPYEQDQRPGSATLGQMLYELWPHPITQLPYTFGCQANWPQLTAPNDTVPYPLTDEIVKMRAYEMVYLWKESQKGDEMERGSGANWQFLSQAMRAEYTDRLKRIRLMDRNLVDLYFTKMQRFPSAFGEPYSTVEGQLNVGGWGD
jgi:hypothetical protein